MTRVTTAPAEEEISPDLVDGGSEGELLEIALGPHHPSTHGVFRMDVVLDGEREGGAANPRFLWLAKRRLKSRSFSPRLRNIART